MNWLDDLFDLIYERGAAGVPMDTAVIRNRRRYANAKVYAREMMLGELVDSLMTEENFSVYKQRVSEL